MAKTKESAKAVFKQLIEQEVRKILEEQMGVGFRDRAAAKEKVAELMGQIADLDSASKQSKYDSKEWDLAKYHVQQAIRVLKDLS